MRRIAQIFAVLCLLAAIASQAFGDSSDGLIHGCVTVSSTGVAVLSLPGDGNGSCAAGQQSLTWQREGQPGYTGKQGSQGPLGPNGAVGAQGATGSFAGDSQGSSPIYLITDRVPHAQDINQSSIVQTAYCGKGDVALGGGFQVRGLSVKGYPHGSSATDATPEYFHPTTNTSGQQGWTVSFRRTDTVLHYNANTGVFDPGDVGVGIYVDTICARNPSVVTSSAARATTRRPTAITKPAAVRSSTAPKPRADAVSHDQSQALTITCPSTALTDVPLSVGGTDAAGAGQQINLTWTAPNGTTITSTVYTNGNGQFSDAVNAPDGSGEIGQWSVKAATADDTQEATCYPRVVAYGAPALQLQCGDVGLGDPFDVTGTVSPAESGLPVTLEYTPASNQPDQSIGPVSRTTDSGGNFADTTTEAPSDYSGEWDITASATTALGQTVTASCEVMDGQPLD